MKVYQTAPRLDLWRSQLIWAWNQALWDAPSKVLAKDEPDPHLLLTTQLAPELKDVSRELIMISAYFVPGAPGLAYLTGRADAGVSGRLLTNALEATDVRPQWLHTIGERGSDSSLHSKAMIFDRQKAFIGSFNFDPRSVLWNTEVGVRVDSPELAERVRELALQGMAPALSYQVRLEQDQVVWVTEDNGQMHTLTREPGSGWRRFNAWLSNTVGLERML